MVIKIDKKETEMPLEKKKTVGRPPRADKTQRVTIYLPQALAARVKLEAETRKQTLSAFFETLLEKNI